MQTSRDLFLQEYGDDERFDVRGSNTIVTSTWNEYFVNLENYHSYAITDHIGWMLRWKNKELKKWESDMMARKISIDIGIKSRPSHDDDDTFSWTPSSEDVGAIYLKELEWCSNALPETVGKKKDLGPLITLHYRILEVLNGIDDAPAFTIMPIAHKSLPFITLCKKSLEELRSYVSGKHCPLSECKKKKVKKLYSKFPSIECSDVLKLDKYVKTTPFVKFGIDYGPTFLTNGVYVNMPWQYRYTHCKTYTDKEYTNYLKSKEEYELKKKEKIRDSLREKGYVDKRITRPREPSVWKKSKYQELLKTPLQDCVSGLFHYSCLSNSTIEDGTPIVTIDPGHRNILTAVLEFWGGDQKKYDPVSFFDLSLGCYYDSIGNKAYNKSVADISKKNGLKPILEELSKNSLKVSNFDIFKQHLKVVIDHLPKVMSVYSTMNQARKRFRRRQLKQSFLDTIVKKIAPDPKTIIVLGDAKFAVSRKGLSACPIALVVAQLAKERRVVVTPETCTTMRCSKCRTLDVNTVSAISTREETSKRTGITYHPKIHGLRHCKKCAQTWGRDVNAARNIFFMFCSLVFWDRRAPYLEKRKSGRSCGSSGHSSTGHSNITQTVSSTGM